MSLSLASAYSTSGVPPEASQQLQRRIDAYNEGHHSQYSYSYNNNNNNNNNNNSQQQQQQQQQQKISNPFTFSLDVPITEGDISRWAQLFKKTTPNSNLNLNFTGGFLDPAAALALQNFQEMQHAVHKLAPMKLFNFSKVLRVPMTKILMHRRKWLPYRQRLPIYQCRGPILDALLSKQVLTLVAPPFSGRTLQMPQIISETEAFKNKRLIVVCNTNISVIHVAKRLREECGEDVTSTTNISVCIPTQYEVHEGTLIAVTTPEIFVRQLLCDPLLLHVSCVILNDVHLRSPILEFCMSLLRSTLKLLKDPKNEEKRGGSLRIVADCFEDSVATNIAEFFGNDSTARINLQQVIQQDLKSVGTDLNNLNNLWSPPCLLHLEETIQWITKCEEEGSFICRDPIEDVRQYVENIGVVAKIMAAEEADFTNDEKLQSYWCPIIFKAINEYDRAERKEFISKKKYEKEENYRKKPSIVVIAPNSHTITIIEENIRNLLENSLNNEENEEISLLSTTTIKTSKISSSSPFIIKVLHDCDTNEDIYQMLQDDKLTNINERLVIITNPIISQSVLPSFLEVGLVIDCARNSYSRYDPNVDADIFSTRYSYVHELHYRRTVARIRQIEFDGLEKKDKNQIPICMVIRLIPKSILYGVQHRRVSADPAHHTIFQMNWNEYVEMYHLLQAREEGIRCREVDKINTIYNSSSITTNNLGNSENNNSYILSSNIMQLISSNFIGISNASSSRYEQLQRIFISVENYLIRLSHLNYIKSGILPQLSPFGIATTCLPLPLPVVRLLILSRLYDCIIPATLVASIIIVQNMFFVNIIDEKMKQLMKEARVFFANDSGNDIISSFNAYRMWLSQRQISKEDEEAFLNECQISKEILIQIETLQLSLLHVLEETGISNFISSLKKLHSNDNDKKLNNSIIANAISSNILEIPENALLEDHTLLKCITAAAYPQCAIPHKDGTVSSFGFSDNLITATSNNKNNNNNNNNSRNNILTSRPVLHFALFSEQSVMSMEEVYEQYSEKPFLYLNRTRIPKNGGTYILEEAIPLSSDAAIIISGEWFEYPITPVDRCRGWNSIITTAWRQTKKARLLPPPAQLPPISINIQPYDIIQAKTVVVRLDNMISFSMRSTTLKWLQQMREETQIRLKALLCDKSWPENNNNNNSDSIGLEDAWNWWTNRSKNAKSWLHEERNNYSSDNKTTFGNIQGGENSLFPYYQYTTNPGKPQKIIPKKKNHNIPTESLNSSGINNNFIGKDTPTKQSLTYMGAIPDPVMKDNILRSAKAIAKHGNREKEAEFLNKYPDLFAFLHPEHEYHAYYLHILRTEAPHLEVLGDNLEELEIFLQKLEEELQETINRSKNDTLNSYETETYNTNNNNSNKGLTGNDVLYQFQEINTEEEYMASYGMQVETAAERPVRPPVLFKTNDILNNTGTTTTTSTNMNENVVVTVGVPATSSFFSQSTITDNTSNVGPVFSKSADNFTTRNIPSVDPTASIGNFTFDRGATTTTTAVTETNTNTLFIGESNEINSTGGAAPTLMERLLAMKGGNNTNTTPSTEATFLPNTNTEELMPLSMTGNASPQLQQTQQQQNNNNNMLPPTTAELLVLMGIIPPTSTSTSTPTPTATPTLPLNPLLTPPPPLPAEALANRPPSILAYPLPPRDYGNIPLILAKALGETMGVKVGPTRIVGDIARIDVPNHKVEARALQLKTFTCVGKRVYIFKNDRIVDGVRQNSNKSQAKMKNKGRGEGKGNSMQKVDHNLEKQHYEKYENDVEHNEEEISQPGVQNFTGYPPYNNNNNNFQDEIILMEGPDGKIKSKSNHPPQIGLLTDSEDEDEDEEEDNENGNGNDEEKKLLSDEESV